MDMMLNYFLPVYAKSRAVLMYDWVRVDLAMITCILCYLVRAVSVDKDLCHVWRWYA